MLWRHGPMADRIRRDHSRLLAPGARRNGLKEDHDARIFLVAFDELLKRCGADEAVIVHHMGHNGERSRGDSRIQDWPDAIWKVVKDKEAENPDDPAVDRYCSAYGRDVDVSEGKLDYTTAAQQPSPPTTATPAQPTPEAARSETTGVDARTTKAAINGIASLLGQVGPPRRRQARSPAPTQCVCRRSPSSRTPWGQYPSSGSATPPPPARSWARLTVSRSVDSGWCSYL
jgi:hypothetical protein